MYANRVDQNQSAIVKGLRKVPGLYVFSTAGVKKGFPDLVVGYRGKTYLFEVKMPGGELTDRQKEFMRSWTGEPVYIVETLVAVQRILGISDG